MERERRSLADEETVGFFFLIFFLYISLEWNSVFQLLLILFFCIYRGGKAARHQS